jgi:hypothetical protein
MFPSPNVPKTGLLIADLQYRLPAGRVHDRDVSSVTIVTLQISSLPTIEVPPSRLRRAPERRCQDFYDKNRSIFSSRAIFAP